MPCPSSLHQLGILFLDHLGIFSKVGFLKHMWLILITCEKNRMWGDTQASSLDHLEASLLWSGWDSLSWSRRLTSLGHMGFEGRVFHPLITWGEKKIAWCLAEQMEFPQNHMSSLPTHCNCSILSRPYQVYSYPPRAKFAWDKRLLLPDPPSYNVITYNYAITTKT